MKYNFGDKVRYVFKHCIGRNYTTRVKKAIFLGYLNRPSIYGAFKNGKNPCLIITEGSKTPKRINDGEIKENWDDYDAKAHEGCYP